MRNPYLDDFQVRQRLWILQFRIATIYKSVERTCAIRQLLCDCNIARSRLVSFDCRFSDKEAATKVVGVEMLQAEDIFMVA
jgi:hypothetical protein